MLSHLGALVPGQRAPQLHRQEGDCSGDGVSNGLCAMAGQCGALLTRAMCRDLPRARFNEIVKRVVGSTSVPIAELRRPRIRSPTQCDGGTEGPAIMDVFSLFDRGAFFSAPFKNSISRASPADHSLERGDFCLVFLQQVRRQNVIVKRASFHTCRPRSGLTGAKHHAAG